MVKCMNSTILKLRKGTKCSFFQSGAKFPFPRTPMIRILYGNNNFA